MVGHFTIVLLVANTLALIFVSRQMLAMEIGLHGIVAVEVSVVDHCVCMTIFYGVFTLGIFAFLFTSPRRCGCRCRGLRAFVLIEQEM